MGVPGTGRHDSLEVLSDYFDWKKISTGKLLREHVASKGPYASRIQDCFNNFQFVDDEIVVELVKKEIDVFEKKCQSWICEGFPRTKVQALSLQKMGIIPDKFVNVNIKKHNSLQRIKQNIVNTNQELYGDGADEVVAKVYSEHEMNMKAVCETFNQFIYQCDATEKQPNDVTNDLARMLRIRFRNNAPRRPPKVIIIGPPGSGKTT